MRGASEWRSSVAEGVPPTSSAAFAGINDAVQVRIPIICAQNSAHRAESCVNGTGALRCGSAQRADGARL